jgi:C-terminal processing protease CtpA/Prc
VKTRQKDAADRARLAEEHTRHVREQEDARRREEQDRLADAARQRREQEARDREESARNARLYREQLERQEEADRQGSQMSEDQRRGRGNPNSHTFGALGTPAQGGGIFVHGSVPNTPSASLGLEYGDVIYSINGVSVNTQEEYVHAVHESPDTMNFVFRDVRTGQVKNASVRLNRPGS